jgi:adenylylsulfate kinase
VASVDGVTMVRVLLLTGSCGTGKSVIAAEINDALAERKVPNAAIDLDALTWQWPPSSPWNNDLMFASLAALWTIHAGRGVTHLTLARVIEDSTDLERYRAAVPGADITICRLTTPTALRIERLVSRMPPGPSRDWHIARTVELESILDRLAPEDFIVENDDRPVRDVAMQVLDRAGWITAANRRPAL